LRTHVPASALAVQAPSVGSRECASPRPKSMRLGVCRRLLSDQRGREPLNSDDRYAERRHPAAEEAHSRYLVSSISCASSERVSDARFPMRRCGQYVRPIDSAVVDLVSWARGDQHEAT
jgi:hypothetical protein